MNYNVFIRRSAQKELETMRRELYENVKTSILDLSTEPRPRGCAKLTGRNGWRIRVGSFRVIYEIDDESREVTVIAIGHRRDIYK